VQVRQPWHWLRAVELEEKGQVFVECLFSDVCALLTKSYALPVLSLVLAEVQDFEGLAAFDVADSIGFRGS